MVHRDVFFVERHITIMCELESRFHRLFFGCIIGIWCWASRTHFISLFFPISGYLDNVGKSCFSFALPSFSSFFPLAISLIDFFFVDWLHKL